MASNESVAAELRKLLMKNNQLEQLLLANWVAGDNPGAIVNIPGLAEGIAELLEEAAHTGSLEPLIAQLEAPSMTPTTADEIMAKRIKEECWDPDCETFDLAHCQVLVGLHRMAPDPAHAELRKAARADFSKECERFHDEGHKCATCGRIDSKEIERRVQAARDEALREPANEKP